MFSTFCSEIAPESSGLRASWSPSVDLVTSGKGQTPSRSGLKTVSWAAGSTESGREQKRFSATPMQRDHPDIHHAMLSERFTPTSGASSGFRSHSAKSSVSSISSMHSLFPEGKASSPALASSSKPLHSRRAMPSMRLDFSNFANDSVESFQCKGLGPGGVQISAWSTCTAERHSYLEPISTQTKLPPGEEQVRSAPCHRSPCILAKPTQPALTWQCDQSWLPQASPEGGDSCQVQLIVAAETMPSASSAAFPDTVTIQPHTTAAGLKRTLGQRFQAQGVEIDRSRLIVSLRRGEPASSLLRNGCRPDLSGQRSHSIPNDSGAADRTRSAHVFPQRRGTVATSMPVAAPTLEEKAHEGFWKPTTMTHRWHELDDDDSISLLGAEVISEDDVLVVALRRSVYSHF
ncbi:unnamed protein product [Jaminaea pallidilutea]